MAKIFHLLSQLALHFACFNPIQMTLLYEQCISKAKKRKTISFQCRTHWSPRHPRVPYCSATSLEFKCTHAVDLNGKITTRSRQCATMIMFDDELVRSTLPGLEVPSASRIFNNVAQNSARLRLETTLSVYGSKTGKQSPQRFTAVCHLA